MRDFAGREREAREKIISEDAASWLSGFGIAVQNRNQIGVRIAFHFSTLGNADPNDPYSLSALFCVRMLKRGKLVK